MPADEQQFRAAQVEALLSTAFEAAELAEGDELPDDVKAHLAAIGAMQPGDLDMDDGGEDDGTPLVPAPSRLPPTTPAPDDGQP